MASVTVVSAYDGIAKALVRAAKFGHNRAAAESIGALIAHSLPNVNVDVVTTVPTLPRHIRQRGYDHAKLIGQTTAKQLARPYQRLLRRSNTTFQVGKNRQERLHQAKNSINIVNICNYRTVLLIDDVITTGATIDASTAALHLAGIKSVYVAAFAQQPLANK